MDLILSEIDKALKRKGLSDAAASKLAVGHPSLIKNFRMKRDGEKRYNMSALVRLAEVLDLELCFGPADQMKSLISSEPYQTAKRLQDQFKPVLDMAKQLPMLPSDAAPGSDFTYIPKYDEYLSAGDGVFAWSQEPPDHLAFSTSWLSRMGLNANSAMAVNIRGDSMEPTLSDGDTVLVDRSRQSIENGKVYAFNDVDGTSKVKRLQVATGQHIVIRSDNPEHETLIRTGDEMNQVSHGIIGQVVWSAHTWELETR